MAFKPFNFTFTPPRTVPTPPPASTPIFATGTASASPSGVQSKAGTLASQLDDLTAMSQYLQDAIVARTGRTAIEINPAVDPEMARALISIYATENPPNFVTVSMLDHLLDAHLGALQLDMAVGNDSTIQPNPLQVGDLMTVVNTVNDHLVGTGNYQNWLPLQLAALKGDSILFQSWKAALQSYPAYYAAQGVVPTDYSPSTIQAAGLDVSDDLASFENSAIVSFSQSYSVIYQFMAAPSPVEQDINNIVLQYLDQPLENVLRIIALLGALVGLSHKIGMENIQGDINNYAFVRLASDTSSMLHSCDQLASLAVSPLQGTLGSLGRVLAASQAQASQVGIISGGPLAGLSKSSSCAANNPSIVTVGIPPLTVPGLGAVSAGLQALAEKLDWGMRLINSSTALVDRSFQQLIGRRLKQVNDTNSLMCSIRVLNALIAAARGVVKEFQGGTIATGSTPQQKQESANRILTSLQTGSNTTFTTSSDQVIVNPPDMPPVTPPVQNVLSLAKVRTTFGVIGT